MSTMVRGARGRGVVGTAASPPSQDAPSGKRFEVLGTAGKER